MNHLIRHLPPTTRRRLRLAIDVLFEAAGLAVALVFFAAAFYGFVVLLEAL